MRVAARGGAVQHAHRVHVHHRRIRAERKRLAFIQHGPERPHQLHALVSQVALGAARVKRHMRRLHRSDHVKLGQALHVAGQEVLQVLKAVMASLGKRAELRTGILEDVQRLVNRRIADGVDAHGVALLGCLHHQRTHLVGLDGGPAAVVLASGVAIRLGHPCGVLAGYAIEELLETGAAQHRACITRRHRLEPAHILKQGREEVHAAGQLVGVKQTCVHIVADEVQTRVGHKRHIAHARDAVLRQRAQKPSVGIGDLVIGKRVHDTRHQLHGGRFAHNARQLAIGIPVVASSRRGHAVAVDSQFGQRAAVEPQRVRVAGVQRHGAVGEGLVKRVLRRQHRRVPSILAPALGQQPPFGSSLGETLHALNAIGLVLAQEIRGKRGRVHCGMEEVHVRVMEAGGDKGVAVVDHFRLGVRVSLMGERKRVILRSDEGDLVPGNGDGKFLGAIGQTGEYARAAKNAVDSHIGPPFPQTLKARPDAASSPAMHLSAFRFRHMPARI